MPSHRRLIAALGFAFALTLAACGGGDPAQLTDSALRSEVPAGVEVNPDQPPEQLAEKDITATCANDLGTGDPAFEAAFCAYRDAALAATSGPDGVRALDPTLLSAGDDALALHPSDPAAALARLESATAALDG